ncbi:hypothetical protein [Parvibaculum sp. MBR-TMA-1.3b-4.2]|jgi:hypothetical protein
MNKVLLGCLCIALLAGCKDNSSPPPTSGTSSLGLELSGTEGLVTTLAGSDLLGSETGTAGAVNDLLGGTNPLMEQLQPVMEALQPIGVPLDELVEGSLNPALAQLSDPGLGASGPDSPLTQLLGGDILGSLVGTEEGTVPVIVAGTDGGILGALLSPVTDNLPAEASLAPVTQPLITALSGSGAGDLSGDLGGLGAPLSPVTDLLNGGSEGLLGNLIPAGN